VCRIVLHDGVDYTWCPRCRNEVDWIDGRYRVLACGRCDLLVNKRFVEHDACPNCTEPLTSISGPLGADEQLSGRTDSPLWVATRRTGLALIIVQAVLALLDPDGFPYLGPLLVFAQLGAFLIVVGALVVSPELRAISTYQATRVIHGIEHAAINVLVERGLTIYSGLTHHGMFTINLPNNGTSYENLEATVRDATTDAISRIRFGEHTLAYPQRCGTSVLVGIALLAVAIVGAGVATVIAGTPSGLTFAVTVGAAFLARALSGRAGLAAQRWFTVSTDFSSAVVTHVEKRVSSDGDTLTAVVMIDVIPKPSRSDDVDVVAPVPL
jgi:hypothetical protein